MATHTGHTGRPLQPLSEDQVQQIRERVSTAVYRKQVHEQRADGSVSEMYTVVYVAQAAHDMMRLLNEVERLRRRVQALQDEIALSHKRLTPVRQEHERLVDDYAAAMYGNARLREQNVAMRELVQDVAKQHDNGYGVCVVCGCNVNTASYGYGPDEPHTPSCYVPKACAILAIESETTAPST